MRNYSLRYFILVVCLIGCSRSGPDVADAEKEQRYAELRKQREAQEELKIRQKAEARKKVDAMVEQCRDPILARTAVLKSLDDGFLKQGRVGTAADPLKFPDVTSYVIPDRYPTLKDWDMEGFELEQIIMAGEGKNRAVWPVAIVTRERLQCLRDGKRYSEVKDPLRPQFAVPQAYGADLDDFTEALANPKHAMRENPDWFKKAFAASWLPRLLLVVTVLEHKPARFSFGNQFEPGGMRLEVAIVDLDGPKNLGRFLSGSGSSERVKNGDLDYDLTNNALGAVMNDLKREVGNNKVVIKYGF